MTAHAALAYPLEERLDYLLVLAALVGVDETVSSNELGLLAEFCDKLESGGENKEAILAFARDVDPVRVVDTCERLATSELRFTLVSDLLYIAHADDRYDDAEREVIGNIARRLGITWRQLDAMDAYARSVLRARVSRLPTDDSGDDAMAEELRENATAGLAAAGVPLAAVAVAGAGLTPLKIAGGLAAMGMGTVGVGVGVAAALGVVSFYAVRGLQRMLR